MADIALDGTVSCSSSADGTLNVSWALSGTVAGASAVTGNLDKRPNLTGTISCVSTVAGNLYKRPGLTGTVDGASAVSAELAYLWQYVLGQGYRIAETALERYELYVGEDTIPDFDSAPQDQSVTLPFSYAITPPISGTKKVYSVLRQRSKYGLISVNQQPTIFVIDSSGDLVLASLSVPTEVRSYATLTGYADVIAKYNYANEEDPADDWEVYAKLGSDPVIGVDSPIITKEIEARSDGTAYLKTNVGPFATGTLHVLVAVKRDADGERAEAAVVQVSLPAAPVLDSELASVFGGIVHEAL